MPISALDSDDDHDDTIGLQPRYLIFDKVFELYRHFQRHPVLLPSIGRVRNNKIVLFDGQHKIAGLLWTGRRDFECKVYLTPDLRLLNQTNISAHDKFAQTRFYSSIMVGKLGTEFGKDFESYKNLARRRCEKRALTRAARTFALVLEALQKPPGWKTFGYSERRSSVRAR
ncbi:MAG TPA: hypothetical protein VF973_08860 [Myxococcales bacterium]